MDTVRVGILNAESIKLLENLAKMGLIVIHKDETTKSKSDDFMDLIQKIRSKVSNPPSLEEITTEVEQQRAEMYAIST
jgi:L-cysteine desulfidase